MIRNKKRFHQQGKIEVRILQHIMNDRNRAAAAAGEPLDTQKPFHHIVSLLADFSFRNHLCLSFPLLSINLYEYVKANNFGATPMPTIRRIAAQLLDCLKYLKSQRIIHCDLKPENILLVKNPTYSSSAHDGQPPVLDIQVIDFGSSCFEYEKMYTYIQSRFYRSPEVMLGLQYATPIDMWSLGCILAELHMGVPIFPGENERDQIASVSEVRGVAPRDMVERSTRKKLFFHDDGAMRIEPNGRGKIRQPSSKTLSQAVRSNDPSFEAFLDRCLQWNPSLRMVPADALEHEWVVGDQHRRGGRGHAKESGAVRGPQATAPLPPGGGGAAGKRHQRLRGQNHTPSKLKKRPAPGGMLPQINTLPPRLLRAL